MRQVVAIYDKDVTYANRLAQYLENVKKLPLQVVYFTKEESLLQFVKGQLISILVVNEQVLTEKIQTLGVQTQIRLLEERQENRRYDIGRKEEGTNISEENCVYKYQSVEVLVQKLLQVVEKDFKLNDSTNSVWNRNVPVIGVYPLMIHDNSFALALAQMLAKEGSVFYCDLGSFSCMDTLLGMESETDLSDAIYYMHQGNLKEQLSSMIRSYGNMDYIAPVRCPEDLRAISAEDVTQFLAEVAQSRGCETVVLRLAECMYMPAELLSLCHVIYMPVRNDLESELRKKKLLAYFENNGKASVWDKIRFVTLPTCKELGAGVPYVEQLLWSEMGDFVRSLL